MFWIGLDLRGEARLCMIRGRYGAEMRSLRLGFGLREFVRLKWCGQSHEKSRHGVRLLLTPSLFGRSIDKAIILDDRSKIDVLKNGY